jgi:hypothetical protein
VARIPLRVLFLTSVQRSVLFLRGRLWLVGGHTSDPMRESPLLADRDPAKYERAALRWHARFVREVPKVEMRESQAILSLLALVPVTRLAAAALAELLARRRGLERVCEVLVAWSRAA